MPNSLLAILLLFVTVAATACDDRPALPDTRNIDQAIEQNVNETADAARSHHDAIRNKTKDMKKRLDPDAG